MNKRIRILFTISNFNTAGSGKVVYDLVHGLDKSKFDVHIACGDNKGAFFKTVEALGVPIHIFETKTHYRPYYSLLFRVRRISKFYKTHNFDIVHSWQWSNDWTEALAARLIGIKWMYTKKAMGFNKHWKIKSFLANFIVTINDEMQQYFPNKNAQKLIPLGIDTTYYSPEHFSKTQSNSFRIITVANLVPVKGIEVLIHAIHRLNDSDITLDILGDNTNDYGQELMQLCGRLGLSGQVVFHGKQADVRPYIVQSDMYVIPTLDQGRKEGMPMALVEAMCMAIPILGSNITGINFVLKEFPELLFPAENAEALSEKIKYIKGLDLESRHQIGEKLRQHCIDHFSMEAFISAHEDLYTKLVKP
ncbi:glycosyltransferase [Psychroserpens algicola]|uniref:glycosyltransferase n=1 Tax=Psychroserpens algicola TaxID=1719034 RepID=UPI0019541C8B|nr:glycosyltransferase [Psychroserpens algicola]